MIYYDSSVCEHCPNNPAVNPHASGICCCSLPYMSTTAPKSESRTYTYGTTTSTTHNYIYNTQEKKE